MADTPSQESVVSEAESKDSPILNDETATAQAFANLLNKDETAKEAKSLKHLNWKKRKLLLKKIIAIPY